MSEKKLLGIDIGTTATKVIVIDTKGNFLAENQNPSSLISKKASWAEESPSVWWNNVCVCVSKILSENEINPADICGVGVSGMVPTLILLDKDGNVLRNSIQQNDARSSVEIDEFRKELDEEDVFQRTGSVITQQSIGPKLLWLRKHENNLLSKACHILGSYDYINYKLTGKIFVEKNWALESGLYDLNTKKWIPEIVDCSSIDISILPSIIESSSIIGSISKEAASLTSLLEGTPVIGGSADHISSAFSAGVKTPGDLLIKLGGAGDILLALDKLKHNKKLFIDYHLIPNEYLINGCMASSGSLVKWFQNSFSEIMDYKELDNLASSVPAGSDGLFCLPYFIGEKTPVFDPLARGIFWGVSLQHTRAHFFRSILEGISYGFLHHIKVINEMGEKVNRVRVTNGGAKSFLWKQITADVVGYPLEIVDKHPGSSLGAAFLAGIGTGLFKTWDDIEQFIKISNVVQPNMSNHEIYENCFPLYRKIYENNRKLFSKVNMGRE